MKAITILKYACYIHMAYDIKLKTIREGIKNDAPIIAFGGSGCPCTIEFNHC